MKVFINDKNEIKDVDTTTNKTLTEVEIPEGVFANWPVAKICCHKLDLENGQYRGFIPCVDTRIIEHIDRLDRKNSERDASISSLQETVDVLVLESLGV